MDIQELMEYVKTKQFIAATDKGKVDG